MESRASSERLRRLCRDVVPAIIALPIASSAVLAAPSQLYGKSVIVSWQEDRQQTTAMDAQTRSITASAELSVYISDAGRPFSRVSMAVTNMRGRTRSGNHDAVQGDGSARSFGFHGNTMSASMPRGNAGAMQVLVTFDSGFQSCSAHVMSGKAGGAGYTRVKSSRVQNGNVFGN